MSTTRSVSTTWCFIVISYFVVVIIGLICCCYCCAAKKKKTLVCTTDFGSNEKETQIYNRIAVIVTFLNTFFSVMWSIHAISIFYTTLKAKNFHSPVQPWHQVNYFVHVCSLCLSSVQQPEHINLILRMANKLRHLCD